MDTISFNGFRYKIKYRKSLGPKHRIGYIEYATSRITIKSTLNKRRKYEVLAHEYAHAVLENTYGVENSESLAHSIAAALIQFAEQTRGMLDE